MPRAKQPPPRTLRLPPEWTPEIKAAAEKRELTEHAFLVKAIRRVLDGDKPK